MNKVPYEIDLAALPISVLESALAEARDRASKNNSDSLTERLSSHYTEIQNLGFILKGNFFPMDGIHWDTKPLIEPKTILIVMDTLIEFTKVNSHAPSITAKCLWTEYVKWQASQPNNFDLFHTTGNPTDKAVKKMYDSVEELVKKHDLPSCRFFNEFNKAENYLALSVFKLSLSNATRLMFLFGLKRAILKEVEQLPINLRRGVILS